MKGRLARKSFAAKYTQFSWAFDVKRVRRERIPSITHFILLPTCCLAEALLPLTEIYTHISLCLFCRINMDENTTLVVTSTESNDINITALDCPQYDDGDDLLLAKFDFWLEGVVQCSVAFSGLIGNAISAFILTR